MNAFIFVQMQFLYLFCSIAGLPYFGVSGRAVNISNAWFLPQEGFPVFYRYFNDKITWNEAEAVCGFHRADLLSVQTNSEMDAARAYLKEIDVTDDVWIGLKKESPEKPFSWVSRNGEKLLGEGYWSEPIPKTNEKLCAAIDPVADFRWNSFYCRGPQVASFVCEHPVPEWAKIKNGCLITSLPSLTVTFIPEIGIIQLLSDCGLDGTRRIACNGQTNSEEIIRRLSCNAEAFASTDLGRSTTADTEREINGQQSSWSDASNQITRYDTTKTYLRFTRHRRSPNLGGASTVNGPGHEVTISPPKVGKMASGTLNFSAPAFPHSPYSASVRNAPSITKAETLKVKPRKKTRENSATASEENSSTTVDLLTGSAPLNTRTKKKFYESGFPVKSKNSHIVLMIENKNQPFFVPLSDDILVDNPSLSAVEVVNIDLVNGTANDTVNKTISSGSAKILTAEQHLRIVDERRDCDTENATEQILNVLEDGNKGIDVPLRPNRGRLLTHSNRPAFYPRLLNRLLG